VKLVRGWVAVNSHKAVRADVGIRNGRIQSVIRSSGMLDAIPSLNVDLEGYLIMPGLVNAHDHLEFNLFSRLGNGVYPSSEAWANDIYQPARSPLREHLAVPKPVRLWWGGLKNLLSGVTTVCHHNPYEEEVFGGDFPVDVVKRYGWAHSLAFEKDPLRAFASTPAGAPFIIHLAEGTDSRSRNEIFVLDQLGALGSRTVIVHGVALSSEGHALRRRKGAALIWCPTSNRFTLGTTLEARLICKQESIALGSDSALTAQGNLLDEIRAAHQEDRLGADAIYSMVTEFPASILRLHNGEGRLAAGGIANLIAVRWNGSTPAETLVEADLRQIELVLLSGRPHLLSPQMAQRWPRVAWEGLEWITVDGIPRLVRAPVRRLLSEASQCLLDGVRLAGREVSP